MTAVYASPLVRTQQTASPLAEARGLPVEAASEEARWIEASVDGVRVASAYVPNGRGLDSPEFPRKLAFLAAMWVRAASAGLDLVAGDLNVTAADVDVYDPAAFAGSTHVTEPERAAFEALVDTGLSDVTARPGKNDRPFTYWDYRAGRFHQDLGMRIDYVLLSPSVTVQDAYVDREARKGTGPSDHAPVVVDLTLP